LLTAAGFAAGAGFAAASEESESASVESLAPAGGGAFDVTAGLDGAAAGFEDPSPAGLPVVVAAGVAAAVAGGVAVVALLEAGLEAGGFDAVELAGAAFGGICGTVALGVLPAGVKDEGVEDEGVEESAGEVDGADESLESVVAAAGFFGPEVSQLKSWPFQRIYPKPTASASATSIKIHFPAPPRGSSSSSSR
jgi:hypothetical protein